MEAFTVASRVMLAGDSRSTMQEVVVQNTLETGDLSGSWYHGLSAACHVPSRQREQSSHAQGQKNLR